jgi:hypothetical protein
MVDGLEIDMEAVLKGRRGGFEDTKSLFNKSNRTGHFQMKSK